MTRTGPAQRRAVTGFTDVTYIRNPMAHSDGTTISGRAPDAIKPGPVAVSTPIPVDEHRVIQSALRAAVGRLDDHLRPVVSYHMGWSDPQGRAIAADGGKSIRSALAL